jgi:hypothetical protein
LPGTPVRVVAGQRTANVLIVMTHGGAISGVLKNTRGQPGAGRVQAMVASQQGGRRTLRSVASALTEAGGHYRLGSLPPASYIIVAQGHPVDSVVGPGAAPAEPAPVFYPGLLSSANAASVKVAPEEQIAGIDIQLQDRPVTSVVCAIKSASGTALGEWQVTLVPADEPDTSEQLITAADRNGVARFDRVVEGRYLLVATGIGAGTGREWASREITVDGRNGVNVSVALEPSSRVNIRLRSEAPPLPPRVLALPRLWLVDPPLMRSVPYIRGTGGPAEPDVALGIRDIAPGRFVLDLVGMDLALAGGWSPTSVVVNGQETIDLPFDLPSGTAAEAVVTLTNTHTQLSGTFTAEDGQPRSDATLVAFAADNRYWLSEGRRVRAIRPDTAGAFVFRDLPPGDYYLAAAVGPPPESWADPDVLNLLVSGAVRITIRPGEKKTQNLRLRR